MLSLAEAPAAPRGIEALWPGSVREGPHGQVVWREWRYALSDCYGAIPPSWLVDRYPAPPPLLAGPDAEKLRFADALFLDTETTGLSGGTGTYVFLIGVARFLDGQLVLRQFFLPELHGERALLHALDEFAQGCTGLVSFNGKCFDLPLIANRYIMQRSRMRLPSDCHLDLLWPARRVWSRRLPSCALTALEQAVLGVARQGDVPGALIPELYFRYLRTKEATPLRLVFEHNRRDVLALAALAGALCAAFAEPVHYIRHPIDHVALGRLFARQREFTLAQQCFTQALTGRLPRDERGWAWFGLAECHLRLGRPDEALPLLQAAARQGGPAGLEAAITLAKYLEHQARDYAAAAEATAQALTAGVRTPRVTADLSQRMARLQRKQRVTTPADPR